MIVDPGCTNTRYEWFIIDRLALAPSSTFNYSCSFPSELVRDRCSSSNPFYTGNVVGIYQPFSCNKFLSISNTILHSFTQGSTDVPVILFCHVLACSAIVSDTTCWTVIEIYRFGTFPVPADEHSVMSKRSKTHIHFIQEQSLFFLELDTCWYKSRDLVTK